MSATEYAPKLANAAKKWVIGCRDAGGTRTLLAVGGQSSTAANDRGRAETSNVRDRAI
jgi:hypothetical protein